MSLDITFFLVVVSTKVLSWPFGRFPWLNGSEYDRRCFTIGDSFYIFGWIKFFFVLAYFLILPISFVVEALNLAASSSTKTNISTFSVILFCWLLFIFNFDMKRSPLFLASVFLKSLKCRPLFESSGISIYNPLRGLSYTGLSPNGPIDISPNGPNSQLCLLPSTDWYYWFFPR